MKTYFCNVSLFLIVRRCVEGSQDFHCFVVVGVGLQNLFKALSSIFLVSTIHIHLSQTKERQHEGGRGELSSLVVILKRLVIVLLKRSKNRDRHLNTEDSEQVKSVRRLRWQPYLHMKWTRQLIAALSLHGLDFCVVESMEGEMLDLTVVLQTEKHDDQLNNADWGLWRKAQQLKYLFEKEVVGEVVEHHGVAGVNGVSPRQELHSVLNRLWIFVVEL